MKVFTAITFILVFLFCSCQKVVNLKLNTIPPQIVIQGEITDSGAPYLHYDQSDGGFLCI